MMLTSSKYKNIKMLPVRYSCQKNLFSSKKVLFLPIILGLKYEATICPFHIYLLVDVTICTAERYD